MNRKFFVAFVLSLAIPFMVSADMSSPQYQIRADVISPFGGESTSSGNQLFDTGGEVGAQDLSGTGGTGGILGGFWRMITEPEVVEENHDPEAEANGPYSGTVGIPVNFSANGSDDEDDDDLEYDWDFGDGGNSTQKNPSHTFTAPGSYSVELKVTDEHGADDTDSTTAQIAPAIILPAECSTNSECTDSIFCNGEEVCQAGTCVHGGLPCTGAGQVCSESEKVCKSTDDDDDIIIGEEKPKKPIEEEVADEEKSSTIIGVIGNLGSEVINQIESVIQDNPTAVSTANTVFATVSILPVIIQLSSIKDILLLIFNSFLSLFGLVFRKRHDWGVVYDAKTGAGVPLVAINIYDEKGKKRDRQITDKNGAYVFLVPAGVYTLGIEKDDFEIAIINPESKVAYAYSYAGGPIQISDVDLVRLNIPIKPIAAGEAKEAERKLAQPLWQEKVTNALYKFLAVLFYAGFAFSFLALFFSPDKLFSVIIFIFYLVCAAVRKFAIKEIKWGTVSSLSGLIAPFTIVQVFDASSNEFVARTVSDEYGRYIVMLQPGTYAVKAIGVKGERWSGSVSVKEKEVLKKKIELT